MKSFPIESVSPDDTRTELLCGITRTTLKYFSDVMGDQAVREVVASTRMNYEYLIDSRNWISLRYYCDLLDMLVVRSGVPGSAFNAGMYGTHSGCFGVLKTICAAVLSPSAGYRFWVDHAWRWNHVAKWKVLAMEKNRCRLSTTLLPGFKNSRNNCLAIQGFLASLPPLWNLPPAKVTEVQCNCNHAESCVYDVVWISPPAHGCALIGGVVGLGVGVALFVAGVTSHMCTLLLGVVGLSIGTTWQYRALNRMLIGQNSEQVAILEKTVRDVEQLNMQLQERVELRTCELRQALKEVSEAKDREVLTARQAAVGALAAGMAHEMNNPLHAAAVAVQGLQAEAGNHPEWGPFLAIIDRSTKRCRRIIGEILSFSRDSKRARADVTEIVRSAVDTFRHENPPDIEVHLSLHPDLPKVMLDAAQIRQALLNLLTNAMDAMQGRGVVRVAVEPADLSVTISVADSGVGMTEDVKRRIFDPFFTTKQKGMGMGLSITWQLVRKNGGTIDVESREGGGSTFRIHLPITGEAT